MSARAKRVYIAIMAAGILGMVAWPGPCPAKDYVVTFVKETYKSGQPTDGAAAKIYHTWAVETEFGKKLLILVGDDAVRRGWLQEFIKDYNLFLATVREKNAGAFELNTVFEIDVSDLHPIDSGFIEEKKGKKKKRK